MKNLLGFPEPEPAEADQVEEPYRPNRAERRAYAQHKARIKRRGQKAYQRLLKVEQQVDRDLRRAGIDPDEVAK